MHAIRDCGKESILVLFLLFCYWLLHIAIICVSVKFLLNELVLVAI